MELDDPEHLSLRRAVRVAIALPLGFWICSSVLSLHAGAIYAGFAMFTMLAFIDFQGPMGQRVRAYLAAGLAGSGLIAIGALLSQNRLMAIGGAFLVAFFVFFVAVLRGYFAAATRGMLLALSLSVVQWGTTQHELLLAELGWAIGVLMSIAAALLVWPVRQDNSLREEIAGGLDSAADTIRQLWPPEGRSENAIPIRDSLQQLVNAHERVKRIYDGSLVRPGAGTGTDRGLMQLVDLLMQLRMVLSAVSTAPHDQDAPDSDRERLTESTATALESCATSLRTGIAPTRPEALERSLDDHRDRILAWVTDQLTSGEQEEISARVRAGFGIHVASATAELVCEATELAHTGRRSAEHSPRSHHRARGSVLVETRPARVIGKHLAWQSPWFRNSLRSAAAIALAVAIVAATNAPVGFWVVLGAIMALRSSAVNTGRTAAQAIAGTLVGLILASGLVYVVGDQPLVYWILMPITGFLATFSLRGFPFIPSQAAFTVFVMIFFALVLGPSVRTSEIRLMDVALGAASSLVMSALLWPRGVAPQVSRRLGEAMKSGTAYLAAAVDRLLGGPALEPEAQQARYEATVKLQMALEAFDLYLVEPSRKTIDPHAWTILANMCMKLVLGGDRIHRTPTVDFSNVPCPQVADDMVAAAHFLRTELDSVVGSLPSLESGRVEVVPADSTRPRVSPVGALFADPIPRMRDGMDACLSKLARHPDRSFGRPIVTLLWTQEWLAHMQRGCEHAARVRPVLTGS